MNTKDADDVPTNRPGSAYRSVDLGHRIDFADLLGDVCRLVALVNSSIAFVSEWDRESVEEDHRAARFRSLYKAHHDREIPRLFISIAATLRAKLDDGSWKVRSDESVGWLSDGDDIDHQAKVPLALREACNKIIHATRVDPVTVGDDPEYRSLTGLFEFRGTRNGKAWTAQLWLVKFYLAVADIDFEPWENATCAL